ncbi:MAG: apolipoprotein N-acyltransferase [Spirochaetia bacterium]
MRFDLLRNPRPRTGAIILAVSLLGVMVLILGPFGTEIKGRGPMDFLFAALITAHAGWGIILSAARRRGTYHAFFRAPEVLFAAGFILFLFSYIYASNANMDYVQRFASSRGNLYLAPDSRVERLNSLARFLPFLLLDGSVIILVRLRRRSLFVRESGTAGIGGMWGLGLSLLSAFFYVIALPSFLFLEGIPLLAWVCMVPILYTVFSNGRFWGGFYGVFFGVVQTMLANYWLGTFSLVSLQFITVYYLVLYTFFMTLFVYLLPRALFPATLFVPAAWVLFDFLRSLAFMGYPWAMLGVSQYPVLPLIQTASVTGIWGISFLVYGGNALLASFTAYRGSPGEIRRGLIGFTAVLAVVFAGGAVTLVSGSTADGAVSGERTARVALVQQNTDPRKNDYREGLDTLIRLTDLALPADPGLVAWSETAFVPNIRRWGSMEAGTNQYTRLVHELLEYLREIDTWLLTGNDDYTIGNDETGEEVRHNFNAAVLFDEEGKRVKTYHKIHLVPFTEYFPFRDQLPWMYELLLNFDVHLWTPGNERVVFEHPEFTFCTPICFEDSFPRDVRAFVREGAEVILNLSNDFWSLTEVEAKQHFVNSLFRSVENRRPFLRSTASGVTAHVDRYGRIIETLPYYEEGVLIADISLPDPAPLTPYTRFGDWFPYLCAGIVLVLGVGTAIRREDRRKSKMPRRLL